MADAASKSISDSVLVDEIQALRKAIDYNSLLVSYAGLGPDRVVSFSYSDKRVRICVEDALSDYVQRLILQNRTFYETSLLKKVSSYVTPDDVVVDVGANIGNHSIFFAKICGARQVFAYEPTQINFAHLVHNLQLNKLTNVVPVNKAVGRGVGRGEIASFRVKNSGATQFRFGSGAYEFTSLDTETAIADVSFIKIDVEGLQIEVLSGALQTLKRRKPRVMIELRPKFDEFEAANSLLQGLGYTIAERLDERNFLYTA